MAKRIYDVEWEYVTTRHSQHEANNVGEIIKMNDEGTLIDDFGNTDEFDEHYDCDSGWKIKSIEDLTNDKT